MATLKKSHRTLLATTAAIAAGVAIVGGAAIASDHVDTAEVEISPTLDLNDVYAFPGSSDDRIVLVMDVGSPIARLSSARFSANALYQFRIDNDGDAVEDLVIQVLFDDDGTSQDVTVLGPAAPDATGMISTLIEDPVAEGSLNQTFTSGEMEIFAGVRRDPFYIDFEQFVRIIPDRRPATFLNDTTALGRATAFRPAPSECTGGTVTGDPGPFDPDHGCSENLFTGANTLSIVIELPESALGAGAGNDAALGIWATISR